MTNLANLKKIILVIGDILILYLSLFITLWARLKFQINLEIWLKHLIPFTIVYFFWLLIFYTLGLYDFNLAKISSSFFSAFLKSLGLAIVLAIIIFYFIPYFGLTPKTILFLNLLIFALLFGLWRYFFNSLIKLPNFSENVMLIGKDPRFKEIQEKLEINPQLGYKIVSSKEEINFQELTEEISSKKINLIVSSGNPSSNLAQALYQFLALGIRLEKISDFYENLNGKISLLGLDQNWLLENLKQNKIYEIEKRVIDILAGLILGIATIIFLPFIALAIKLDSPGLVFYSQKRVGKEGKIFNLIKLRSMIKDAEKGEALWAEKNDSRITKVGKILRNTLLDELPQFINILKGEMSFVGYRPERQEFIKDLKKEIPFYDTRHLTKPGLTGWAQVNFHYTYSVKDVKEKFQYELFYIKHRSIFLDLKITLKTINLALRGEAR